MKTCKSPHTGGSYNSSVKIVQEHTRDQKKLIFLVMAPHYGFEQQLVTPVKSYGLTDVAV